MFIIKVKLLNKKSLLKFGLTPKLSLKKTFKN